MPVLKKIKIHIALDSNQYIADRLFTKPSFNLIKALVRHDLIRIHIPWFVYKECTTRNIQEIQQELHQAIKGIESLEDMGADPKLAKEFNEAAQRLKLKRDNVVASVEKVWKDFISETNATLYSFFKEDSVRVFEDYFSGGKPFNSLKGRKDIPDAFIYQNLLSIAKGVPLHFICNDDNLRKHLDGQTRIKTYKDLKDFFQSPEYAPVSKEYERLEKYKALEKKLLKRDHEILEYFMDELQSHEPFEATSKDFRSDDNVATINALSSPTVKILTNEILYADDIFYVPVMVAASASIDYFLYKADYYILSDDKKISVSKWNDHYFLAEETVPIVLIYKVAINKSVIEDEDDLQIDFNFKDYSDIYVGLDDEAREMLF
jgi:hypothetical protein